MPVPNPLVSSIFTESAELGSSAAYNVSLALSSKNVNLDAAICRLKIYFDNNEIFKFCVKRELDTVVYDACAEPLNVDVEEYRASSLFDAQQKIKELTAREFRLDGQQLFSIHRLKTDDGHHDFLLVLFHHMVMDGEGLNLLHRHLSSAGPILSQRFAEYIDMSASTYAYSLASLKRYAQSMHYDAAAASHLDWDSKKWTKSVYSISQKARQAISRNCRTLKSTEFSYLFFLAILSFRLNFPSRKSAVIMMPYANRENDPTMHINGCMVNSIIIQIDLTLFANDSDLLSYLSLNLLDNIMRCASFPLVDVILHSGMQPDFIFGHIRHDFNFDYDLSESVYNLTNLYPCSLEIREYLDKTDILFGTDGQTQSEAFISTFRHLIDQSRLIENAEFNNGIFPKGSKKEVTVNAAENMNLDQNVERLKKYLAESLNLTSSDDLTGIEPDSDLFFWGLNSIKGIRFSRSISKEFCNDFSFRHLLKLRTLNNIARHINV